MTKDKTDGILRKKTNTDYGKKNADRVMNDADHGLGDADHGMEIADHGMEVADHSPDKGSYGVDDKASLQIDKLRNTMLSNRKTRIEDSLKTKKAASSSKPSKPDPKKKLKHSCKLLILYSPC